MLMRALVNALLLAAALAACRPQAAAQSFRKPALHRQEMHASEAGSVVYSNAAKNLFASGGQDSTVKLYEATTGRELRTLRGHRGQVFQVAFSPDAALLASAGEDGAARLWDVDTGALLFTLEGHGSPVTSVSFNRAGTLLASGGQDNNVRVWEVKGGKPARILEGHSGYVTAVAFSRDEPDLLASGDAAGEIRLWDAGTPQAKAAFKGHEGAVYTLAFNPRGRLLASGGADGVIKLWDSSEAGAPRATLPGHEYAVSGLAFSPDGARLASCGHDATVRLWSVPEARPLGQPGAHQFRANAVDFSPDGRRLLSSGADEAIRVWDVAGGGVLLTLLAESFPEMQVAVSRDGRRLATAAREQIVLQTVGEGQERTAPRGHAGFVTALAFSPDGELLAGASEDRVVRVWVARTGLAAAKLDPGAARVYRLAFGPDGKKLAGQGEDEVVRVWDVKSRREDFRLTQHPALLSSLAFNRDGKLLACGYRNGDIRVYSAADGKLRHDFKAPARSSPVTALAFSPDGKLLASGESITPNVRFRDANSGSVLHVFDGRKSEGDEPSFAHADDVLRVEFSDDGKLLLSCGRDGAAKIWGVEGRALRATFAGHRAAVREAQFVAGSGAVLSGGVDGEFIVWLPAERGGAEELARLVLVGDDWLVISPDGFFDGSPAAWQKLLWRFDGRTLDFAAVESYYNEFFYPGLLSEIIAGKRPAAPRALAQLDRRQPTVTVSAAGGGGRADAPVTTREVEVTVEVEEARSEPPRGLRAGEARDVRLFRDGSLVTVWRADNIAALGRLADCAAAPAAQGAGRRVVCRARVPVTAGLNRLTAYAFNGDNVKSADASLLIHGAPSLRRPATLYVLAVGVDHYADSSRDLRFAVADVRDIGAAVRRGQPPGGRYARTEVVELTDADATKANVLRALRRLASGAPPADPAPGDAPSASALRELSKLATAQPEDALLIYFAGHGTARCAAGPGGAASCDRFYLIPHEGFPVGEMDERRRLELIYRNSLSDEDMEAELERIGAGTMFMVIDACRSGQIISAEERRRGPMNSKGLAQLAYDKGMYVLAATQSDQFAVEALRLGGLEVRHGLLTYALLEALASPPADRDGDELLTGREWVNYAAEQVPQLQVVKMEGCRDAQGECPVVEGEAGVGDVRRRSLQTPRVFYRREREAEPFVVTRLGVPPAR